MRTSNLSILGLYRWDATLFDSLTLPDGFTNDDKTTLIDNIILECAELETLYPSVPFMKSAIGAWSAKELQTWQRIYNASLLEYNPIENYNRTEDVTETHSGDITHSGKDTDKHTGYDNVVGTGSDTDTHSRTSFESGSFQDTEKIVMSKGATQTNNHNSEIETTHGHKITDTTSVTTSGNISGNIGVTTSQQMLEQELDIAPKLNIFNIITESFKNRFCLLVY